MGRKSQKKRAMMINEFDETMMGLGSTRAMTHMLVMHYTC